jgi:hypothetical protein
MNWFKDWKKNHNKKKWAKKSIKNGFKREFEIRLKEEFLFRSGILIGISFGFIGNFFVIVFFRWIDRQIPFTTFLIICLFFIILILFLFWYWIKIKWKMKKKYLEKIIGSIEWNIIYGKKHEKKLKK